MTSILRDIVRALFQLIPVAILAFFIWALSTIPKKLDRIEALLTDIKDRLPASAAAD
jgi:hypothetical protein